MASPVTSARRDWVPDQGTSTPRRWCYRSANQMRQRAARVRTMLAMSHRESDKTSELVVRTLLCNGSTNQLVVQLVGDASSHNAVHLHEQLEEIISASLPALLIMDLSQLVYINSDGIGVLVALLRKMRSLGGKFRTIAPRGR